MSRDELSELLQPLIDRIREEERLRCQAIACGHKTWDGEKPTRKNIEHWMALIEHGRSIATAIGSKRA